MRVIQLISQTVLGGAESFGFSLGADLARRGHDDGEVRAERVSLQVGVRVDEPHQPDPAPTSRTQVELSRPPGRAPVAQRTQIVIGFVLTTLPRRVRR